MAILLQKPPKKIELSRGLYAIVDHEDFEWLNGFNWLADSKGYAVRHKTKSEYLNSKRTMVKMHREIMQRHGFHINKLLIDHVNQNTLDNRKINLRLCTNSQNQANSKKFNKYKGVVRCSKNAKSNLRKPYAARIYVNGVRHFKGMFETEIEAALEYNRMAVNYFGNFANLNKV